MNESPASLWAMVVPRIGLISWGKLKDLNIPLPPNVKMLLFDLRQSGTPYLESLTIRDTSLEHILQISSTRWLFLSIFTDLKLLIFINKSETQSWSKKQVKDYLNAQYPKETHYDPETQVQVLTYYVPPQYSKQSHHDLKA